MNRRKEPPQDFDYALLRLGVQVRLVSLMMDWSERDSPPFPSLMGTRTSAKTQPTARAARLAAEPVDMNTPTDSPNDPRKAAPDANPDPITGEPGSHPVGTGVGAAGGGAAGAAIGALGGPVGAVIGAVVGAVAGGFAGKGTAEALDPTREEAYWRENFHREPYYEPGHEFADYAPAYRAGYETHASGRTMEHVDAALDSAWDSSKGASRLDWPRARTAAQAAWDRVERATSRRNPEQENRLLS